MSERNRPETPANRSASSIIRIWAARWPETSTVESGSENPWCMWSPYVVLHARRLVVELGYTLLQHTVLRRLHRTCLRRRRRNNEFQLPRNWGAPAREEAMPGWARAVALDGWELAREVGIWVCGCGGSHEIWNPSFSLSLTVTTVSFFFGRIWQQSVYYLLLLWKKSGAEQWYTVDPFNSTEQKRL